jgi:hypothetical protein
MVAEHTIYNLERMRCSIAWLAVAAATATAQSQSPAGPGTDKLPEFEVATIRLADPNGMHTIGVQIYPNRWWRGLDR